MQPEGSLPSSKQPATGTDSEPDESSTHLATSIFSCLGRSTEFVQIRGPV
jgi:hypothetical protein